MKTAGLFHDLNPQGSSYYSGSIRENIGQSRLPDADKVVSYLRSGHGLIDTMEACEDVLGSGRFIPGGSSMMTDGVWLWRQDLSFYVERHNVLIPSEFLQFIRSNDYRVPDVDLAALRAASEEAERVLDFQ